MYMGNIIYKPHRASLHMLAVVQLQNGSNFLSKILINVYFREQRPCSHKITVVYIGLNTGIVTPCIQFDDKLSVSNQLIQK